MCLSVSLARAYTALSTQDLLGTQGSVESATTSACPLLLKQVKSREAVL